MIAKCKFCGKLMKQGGGCSQKVFTDMGPKPYKRIPHDGDGLKGTANCHDCAVAPGKFHHVGCDAETCPKCGGQAIGCGCIGG